MKKLKLVGYLYLVLLLTPIAIGKFFPTSLPSSEPITPNYTPVAYAANWEQAKQLESSEKQADILLLFTHSHESYIPIVQSKSGKKMVYDATTNITKLSDMIAFQFGIRQLHVDTLPVDNMLEMKKRGVLMRSAYENIRPILQDVIREKPYDLIIDLHRDSTKHDLSTIEVDSNSFAKIAFIVGAENKNFRKNHEISTQLSNRLETMIPGISRGVISKSGDNVDGVYNQDLSENMVLIEIGGIESTEEEINRTISVLAQAIADWRSSPFQQSLMY
ncbi:stage II sporulation protein P [Paenisporosarcina cavernae]|uniref:Stage II sporulation protein P n=1 Tax=Paenisporosarcina cavernae TaxID=2320858 RepID=A0A385YSC0_9BACL|nr:stage II sporulation protein P [Paenisporosarcina cavernae]AYC29679.1 stage II sporulation protein P [Paenisporosarcina cavernae]